MLATAQPDPVVGASVDLGATSVHLLVASVASHRLQPLVDESVFLGLGRAIAERGLLGRDAREALTATLVAYATTARRLGADNLTFVGTEPIRRAADASVIVHEVGIATGAPLHVLGHEEEAYLTIIGVTEGRPAERETLVVDVGGGSSEFCVVDPTNRPRAVGLRLGSAGLTDRLVTHDPPTPTELGMMRDAALDMIGAAPDATPAEIVAVGGTASNLLRVVPAAMLDRVLTRARIDDAVAVLTAEPADDVAERYHVNPARARLLPGGAAIMAAIIERYGVDRIRVSDAGIREGLILAVAHAGAAWRDRLPDLAHGWRG